MPDFDLPESVLVRDVVMRDGIQNLSQTLPTGLKVEIIEGLAEAGVRRIEAASFMNPKAVPATADAEEVMRRIRRRPGVRYEALVANRRGARRAADAGRRTPDATGFSRSSPSRTRTTGRTSTARSSRAWRRCARCPAS